jgi:hypothetical protein
MARAPGRSATIWSKDSDQLAVYGPFVYLKLKRRKRLEFAKKKSDSTSKVALLGIRHLVSLTCGQPVIKSPTTAQIEQSFAGGGSLVFPSWLRLWYLAGFTAR